MKLFILIWVLLSMGGCMTTKVKPIAEEVQIIDALTSSGCIIKDYRHELKRSVVQIQCGGK